LSGHGTNRKNQRQKKHITISFRVRVVNASYFSGPLATSTTMWVAEQLTQAVDLQYGITSQFWPQEGWLGAK